MEKDYQRAIIRSSGSFIITTNHDQDPSRSTAEAIANDRGYAGLRTENDMQSMADLIDESKERQASMQSKWYHRLKDQQKIKRRRVKELSQPGVSGVDLGWKQNGERDIKETMDSEVSITLGTAFRWLWSYPIVNEDTHCAVLMDPVKGRFIYAGKFPVLSAEEENILWGH